MSKQIENDKLKDIFAKVKGESPSMSFENNLMQRIRAQHVLAERKKSKVALFSMILGIVGIVVVPSAVLSVLGWSILDVFKNSEVNFINILCSFKIDSLTISISLVCLLLLMADSLVRRYFNKKERK